MQTNLAELLAALNKTALKGTDPKLINLTVDSGAGQPVPIPVAFLPDKDGGMQAVPLFEAMERGARVAREQRLAKAEGPDCRAGTANHQALHSFIEHANRFKAENSAVWADASQRRLVSVLDYHPAGAASPARWGRHRGVYACPLSEAWGEWGGGDPVELDQDELVTLLESRDRELTSGTLPSLAKAPDPAALLTLASNLEVFSSASAKRHRDPNTGRVKVSFSEEKGVVGEVMPPSAFLIRIPVFQDAAPVVLEVRLRVTIDEGHAGFTLQIHAAGDVLREAFEGILARVRSGTELPTFIGTPE